jgi:hypothetical protein
MRVQHPRKARANTTAAGEQILSKFLGRGPRYLYDKGSTVSLITFICAACQQRDERVPMLSRQVRDTMLRDTNHCAECLGILPKGRPTLHKH